MKKRILVSFGLLSVIVTIIAAILGCGAINPTGGGGISLLGAYSSPFFQIYKNGSINFSNFLNPATGEVISDAVITVTNATTGVSTTCVYSGGSFYYVNNFNHVTGESVSFSLTSAAAGNASGAATVTPDTTIRIVSPGAAASPSTLPFDVTWEVTAGTQPAGYVWLYIIGSSEGYQVILPIATKSYTLTSSIIAGHGTYYVSIVPVNQMSLTGAASGSTVVVGSALGGASRTVQVN